MMATTTKTVVAKAGSNKAKRARRAPVEVVQSGSAFPRSQRPPRPPRQQQQQPPANSDDPKQQQDSSNNLLEWSDTVQEVRSFASTAFVGQQKRDYQDEEYQRLTGRPRKRHHVPLRIVRGIERKAAERAARQQQEAKEAGIVLPQSRQKESTKKTRRSPPRASTGRRLRLGS